MWMDKHIPMKQKIQNLDVCVHLDFVFYVSIVCMVAVYNVYFTIGSGVKSYL
jgi:hypothetical protein